MSVSVCLTLASDCSETIEVITIIIKLGTVTASDTRMHHAIIILTLTFNQVLTDLSYENDKCSIISETVLSNARQLCCEDSPIKYKVI